MILYQSYLLRAYTMVMMSSGAEQPLATIWPL